jgi:hypothetical protein
MMAPGAVIECDDGARRVADGELPSGAGGSNFVSSNSGFNS